MARVKRALGVDGELLEPAFQAQVVGLARAYGWEHIYHAPAGGYGSAKTGGRRVAAEQLPEGRGFPDLLLIKGRRLIVAELKTRTGRMRPGQVGWLDAFRMVGAAVYEWTNELSQEAFVALEHDEPSVEAYLWRPADWPTIQAVLGAGEDRRSDLDPVVGN